MTDPSSAPGVVASIESFNRGRDPVLVARKYAAMRRGAFAFMRGTCHLFAAEWPDIGSPDGTPCCWLSGDLHAENFGTYRGDNRLTYFDVTDFDETALGPLTWDVGRFLASLLVGGAEWGVAADEVDALAIRALVAYRAELRQAKASWIERDTARGIAKRLFAQVSGRSRTELLDRYTTRRGRRRRVSTDGRHLLPVDDADRTLLETLLAEAGGRVGDQDYFRLVDAARRVAGLGSIGLPRYIVAVEGRGSPDRNVLLDVKSAHPSVLTWRIPAPQPPWEDDAERVVAVHRHAVAVPPAFLQAVHGGGHSYVMRELQPTDDRVRLKEWERQPRKLADAVIAMASVAAWMHLRGAAWRQSAPIEQLADFAASDEWTPTLLDAARNAALRVLEGFQLFASAYDAGALEVLPATDRG